ncbi:MAG TPA: ABC transporter ATP-binding protein [Terriglobales bacterium]|nr:ABC transporter ATP-binding protein [Terriglobales bacterium]
MRVEFATGEGSVPAVREVSFDLCAGEVLGLVGESGSGKSVTSLAILRLLPVQARISGEIRFAGCDLLRVGDEDMRKVRGARISMIFQEPMTALNPVMRVGDQVAEAVLAHQGAGSRKQGVGKSCNGGIGKQEAWRRAVEALRDVQIADVERRVRDYPHQLSGGMRQRVMIAMAMVNRPELLIADEPTTALDVTIQAQILELLGELQRKYGLAMLLISHDLAVVSQVAHRVAVMYAGSIVEMGSASHIFKNATHPYTRGLLEAVPTLATDRARPLKTIEGTVPTMGALPPGCAFEPRCGLRVDECARAFPPLVEVEPGHWARCPVSTISTQPSALSTQ